MEKTANNAAFRRQVLEGKIQRAVQKLARYETGAGIASSAFSSIMAQLPGHLKPVADYDGMLGSIMMESFLSEAFSTAVNDNGHLPAATTCQNIKYNDIVDLLDLFCEYLEDREKDQHSEEKGRGSFALGEHRSICNIFADSSQDTQQGAIASVDQARTAQALRSLLAEYNALSAADMPAAGTKWPAQDIFYAA